MALLRILSITATGTSQEAGAGDIVVIPALRMESIAGDLASPANGDKWYNSITGKFRCKENGTVRDEDTIGGIIPPAVPESPLSILMAYNFYR